MKYFIEPSWMGTMCPEHAQNGGRILAIGHDGRYIRKYFSDTRVNGTITIQYVDQVRWTVNLSFQVWTTRMGAQSSSWWKEKLTGENGTLNWHRGKTHILAQIESGKIRKIRTDDLSTLIIEININKINFEPQFWPSVPLFNVNER